MLQPVKVSIVVPCFNAEPWIAQTINSCLSQTHPSFEVIVIDDGSTDRSASIVRSFDDRVRLIQTPNRGGNAARNLGLLQARGDLVQYVDADDLISPDHLQRTAAVLEDPDVDICYEDWQKILETPTGEWVPGKVEITSAHPDMVAHLLALGGFPPPCSILYRKAALNSVQGWDEKLTSAQDWDLNLRLAIAGRRFVYLPGTSSLYRRPLAETVSKNADRWYSNINRCLDRSRKVLESTGQLSAVRSDSLSQTLIKLSRHFYWTERGHSAALFAQAASLSPNFLSRQPSMYRLLCLIQCRLLAETIARLKRRITRPRS
jgi:glycosyltransferase involved in cell wall biosynthesis